MTTECEGCKKLQAHYKASFERGMRLGKSTSESEILQLIQYIKQFDTTFKENREAFQKEMTDALQEAEDRAEYWRDKYHKTLSEL